MGRSRKRRNNKGKHKRYKNWTGKPVSTGPNPEGYHGLYVSHTHSMGRVSMSDDPEHPLPYIKHAQVVPRPRGATPERKLVVEAIHELWQGDFRQKISKFHYVVLLDSIKLFFAGPQFLFVEEHGTRWRRSIVYESRLIAMDRFNHNKVTWLQWERLSETGYGNTIVPVRET